MNSGRALSKFPPLSKVLFLYFIALSCCTFLLTACEQKPEFNDRFNNYLYRLNNVTLQNFDLDLFEETLKYPDTTYALPRKRLRQLPISDIRLKLVDLINLNDCDLLPNIVKRNTSLGKVMPTSQRLIYEREVLFALEECQTVLINKVETSPNTKTLLVETLSLKQKELKHHYWNGIFASNEFEKLFSVSHKPMWLNLQADMAATQKFLTFYESIGLKLKDPEFTINKQVFETHLQQVQIANTAGQLLASLKLANQYLDAGTHILSLAKEEPKLCAISSNTPQQKILKTVFFKFYIGEIQPYLAKLDQETSDFSLSLNRIMNHALENEPSAQQLPMLGFYKQHLNAEDSENNQSLFRQHKSKLHSHTLAWQALLKDCDLMPSQ